MAPLRPKPSRAVRHEGCPPYDTVRQIQIPNYVLTGKMAKYANDRKNLFAQSWS